MHNKGVVTVIAVVCLGAGPAAPPVVALVKPVMPSVATRVVKGTVKTKRSLPESFKYRLKVPTLKGVAPRSNRPSTKGSTRRSPVSSPTTPRAR